MFEFRGLVANVAGSSKAKNENAGFVTPQNKGLISRKALFTDKPKMALGDLKKNTFNVVTPIKNGTIEKTKQHRMPFQLSTPFNKPSNIFKEDVPTTSKLHESKRNIDYTKDEMDVWNQKLLLSDSQFDMIFMNSPKVAPPSPPSPMPEYYPDIPEYYPDMAECEDVRIDSGYFRNFGRQAQDDERELPAIVFSPMKEH